MVIRLQALSFSEAGLGTYSSRALPQQLAIVGSSFHEGFACLTGLRVFTRSSWKQLWRSSKSRAVRRLVYDEVLWLLVQFLLSPGAVRLQSARAAQNAETRVAPFEQSPGCSRGAKGPELPHCAKFLNMCGQMPLESCATGLPGMWPSCQ